MPSYKLPEYSSLVRWTVQDVVNWLVQIGFSDCTRIFREAGIDGNKLANLTDTELRSINCPNRRIKKLVEYLSEVGPPPQPPPVSNKGFMLRQPPAPVRKDYSAPPLPSKQPNDDGIGSGSDDEDVGWGDDFDSEEAAEDKQQEVPPTASTSAESIPPAPVVCTSEAAEDKQQEVPPTASTSAESIPPAPVVCTSEDSSDQSYEEPAEPVPPPRPAARNDKAFRPPPPVPTQQTKASPQLLGRGRRPPPPTPQFTEDENYEDLDGDVPPQVPAVSSLPARRKVPSPVPVQEDAYEDPDEQPRAPNSIPPQRRKASSPVQVENCDEEYEEPDPEIQKPPHARRPPAHDVLAPPVRKPQKPRIPAPPTPADENCDEEYEEPDPEIQKPPHARRPPASDILAPPVRKPQKPRIPAPPTPADENCDEEYEEPDPEIQKPPHARRPPASDIVAPPVRKPQKPRIPAPPTPADEGEDYEEPDNSLADSGRQQSRRPPIPIPPSQPEPQELYEDPDNQVVVKPTHGGPLPIPPGQKPVVSSTKEAPPRRKHQQGLPEIPKVKIPTPVEPEEQDVYEIPEDEKPVKPQMRGRRELPPPPSESQEQDDYLEMDPDTIIAPPPSKVQLPMSSKPQVLTRNERWKAPEPQPAPPVQDEEYEEPDGKPEPPTRRVKDSKPIGGISVLPGMRMLNTNEKPKQKSTAQKKRELPPPPVADEPVPEPVKPEPVKPRENKPVQKPVEDHIEGDLESYPWYHGLISRPQADARLKENALDGMYCIRKSSKGGDRPYVLVVFFENKVYNLPVRRRSDKKYALGAEKQGEHSFFTLLEMINFFKKNYLVIHASDTGQTRLVKSLPKS